MTPAYRLIKAGANCGEERLNPLMQAAAAGNVRVCPLLIKRGAVVNRAGSGGAALQSQTPTWHSAVG